LGLVDLILVIAVKDGVRVADPPTKMPSGTLGGFDRGMDFLFQ
jgi:hypothetical protein